jgi:exosortase/archaeosortase family protein
MKLSLIEEWNSYKGIIYFMIILLIAHFAWKYTVIGDESTTEVKFVGIDISAPFNLLTNNVAKTTTFVLTAIGDEITLNENNVIRHSNGVAVKIVWACSGLKQMYIFICIMAFCRGPWRKKLWYIPIGVLVVYFFNIFRISFITSVIEHHPSWFDFLHEQAFKYLFYAVIFGMWVFWEEKIAIPYLKTQNEKDNHCEN